MVGEISLVILYQILCKYITISIKNNDLMKIIDNITSRLGEDLKAEITKGSKLSISASSFSIYAFEALKKELKGINELEFIFTSPTFIEDKFQKISREFYIPHIVNESQLCGGDFELRLKNELNQNHCKRMFCLD